MTVKVIGKTVLWEGRFLRAVLLKYADSRGPSGILRGWEAFERVGCDGVVGIVPFTASDEVILIRQFRPPINGHVIELPAGLCDPGESRADAARRELTEETGYSAGKLDFLTQGPMSSGASSEILTVFVATALNFVGIGDRDETEDIEVLKVPLDRLYLQLQSLEKAGNFVDLKVYGLVELAKIAVKDTHQERGE